MVDTIVGPLGGSPALGGRGAWAGVDWVKHRPLRGRCFTELAPETGARLNYRGDVAVREVARDRSGGWGLDRMAP